MRIRTWAFALLGPLLALATAASAFAAEAEAEGGGGRGLFDFYAPEMILAIVIFLVLLFLLTKLAWKPILTGLRQREDTIRQALDGAAAANAEARRLMSEYEARLDKAREEAQSIADESKRHAEEVRRRIEDEARAQAEETLARAERDLARARETAFQELLGSVSHIATEAAARIVKKEITPERNAELVDEVVADFVRSQQGPRGHAS